MLDIKIIAIGKINDKNLKALGEEYLKRLKPYARIKLLELKEEPFSDSNAKQAKEAESKKIIESVSKTENSFVISLDERGCQYSSTEFASYLAGKNIQITFVIGGSLGLTEKVLKKSHQSLSLSKMTFTHEMARIFLLEQIYRAAAINAHKKYHH